MSKNLLTQGLCMKKLFSLPLILLGFAAIISACSSDDSSSNPPSGSSSDKKKAESDDPVMVELEANYQMLDMFYIYAHARGELAESVDAYVGKGTAKDAKDVDADEDRCSSDYYDVCYMYNQMKDPYTRYYDPTIAPEVIEELMEPEEEFVIVGADYVVTDAEEGVAEITYVSDEGKAQGLKVGDVFSLWSFYFAKIGKKPSEVLLLLLGDEEDEFDTVYVQAKIAKQPTVALHYEEAENGDSIPVIRIREFDVKTVGEGGTKEEFAEAIKKTEGSKSVIIDLRNNGGGETEHCNATSAEFLSKGDTITIDITAEIDSVKEKGETRYVQKMDTNVVVADKDGAAKDRYVVMLADDMSASCAELMLSAIATNKKSPIVGALSYGKQIGQIVVTGSLDEEDSEDGMLVPEGLAIITNIYAYDKDWKQFQDLGIVPDYEIKGASAQMKKAVELAAAGTEKRTAGYGTERLGHFAKDATVSNRKASIKDLKRMRYKIAR